MLTLFRRLTTSTMPVDPAIASALSLPASSLTLTSHGGSGFSSTHKLLATLPDSSTRAYFVKIGKGPSFATMFAGEHASLNAIHRSVPTFCPASFGHGPLSDSADSHFLVTDFLELVGRGGRTGGMSLAEKLAKLHTTAAPLVGGRRVFGFEVPTCCGDTEQENGFRESWAEFYAENRLRAIMGKIERAQGKDGELRRLVERTADEVVPRLLADGHLGGEKGIVPVVVHGDLWSGNASAGRIGGKGEVEAVVFDSSACYAHSEFDLGIMRMFGGFGKETMDEYHRMCPKTEPVDEYEDRISLYELYHHLNHTAIFGGSYRSGAMGIMSKLVRKYGEG